MWFLNPQSENDKFLIIFFPFWPVKPMAWSAGAIEYIHCISAVG